MEATLGIQENPKTYDELIEQIRANLNDDKRFAEQLEWIKQMVKNYSVKLKYSELEILTALEKHRNYWAANYYQEANYPDLDKIDIFENLNELLAKFPSRKFICSCCGGITTNPYECNSGIVRKDGKVCDWKTYGFLRTLGEGYRFTIRDLFLEKPVVDEIFTPIELSTEKSKGEE